MNSLQDRMYNFEVTPPQNTWDKIAVELDEAELSNEFPARLYNMETIPPLDVWEKVNASLSPVNETKVVPLSKRLAPILRYAAAAIFIGAVAFGIVKFTATGETKENITVQKTVVKDSNTLTKPKLNEPAETVKANINTNEDDETLQQGKDLIVKSDAPLKRIGRKINAQGDRDNISYFNNTDEELSKTIYAYEDHVPDLAERYVMLMTPDGNIIRMSKKWSDLLCCVSGEEQDAECKDQLKKWQQKIAASPLAPSPGNFMDILGLVNSLN